MHKYSGSPALFHKLPSAFLLPDTDCAGTVTDIHDMVSEAFGSLDVTQSAPDDGDPTEMELEYPDDRPPIYIFTKQGWKVPTPAEALAVTIPFQDPEEPPRAQFGMGLRDSNSQISPYVRQENDDMGVCPREIMGDAILSVDVSTLESDFRSNTKQRTATVNLPKTPDKSTKKRATSLPPPHKAASNTVDISSRKRKATESPTASALPSSSKARPRKSTGDSDLFSILESDDEGEHEDDDDDLTLVGSSPEKSPPRKIRVPNSRESSPLKPKAAMSFAGYQCQMPGCFFAASSPQHIRHHYETFQHSRIQTRGGAARQGS
ncbi:hypothetical protein BC835DRAFT_906987 [Cytidiella melzeri]|nr:hypothetical protein BC835DRAFT_906987 [Cytidiella melzeri]